MIDAAKVEKVKEGLAACFMIDGTCSTCPYFAECYPLQGQSKHGLPYKDTVALIDELTQEIEQLKQRPDVVRCKDCIKRREWFCELDGKYHSPNFFCGFGKPKDGGGT